MTDYWYTGALMLISVLLLTVALGINFSKGRQWYVWLVGVAAAGFALTAGFYAIGTQINAVVGWVVGWNPVVSMILGLVLLGGVVFITAALIPTTWEQSVVSIALVAMVFLLPSAQVSHHLIPGTAGAFIGNTATQLSQPVHNLTAGWFG